MYTPVHLRVQKSILILVYATFRIFQFKSRRLEVCTKICVLEIYASDGKTEDRLSHYVLWKLSSSEAPPPIAHKMKGKEEGGENTWEHHLVL